MVEMTCEKKKARKGASRNEVLRISFLANDISTSQAVTIKLVMA